MGNVLSQQTYHSEVWKSKGVEVGGCICLCDLYFTFTWIHSSTPKKVALRMYVIFINFFGENFSILAMTKTPKSFLNQKLL